MDSRSFVIGALFGAAAFAGGSWLLNDEETEQSADIAGEAQVEPIGAESDSSVRTASHPQGSFSQNLPEIAVPEQAVSVNEPDYEITEPSNVEMTLTQQSTVVPVPVSDVHKWLLGGHEQTEREGRDRSSVHDELEVEPKDDAWGYYMEQTLSQFLGSHASGIQFEIFNIECRTTLCELQVIGYGDAAAPAWSQILYDMRQQPWFDFGETGSSSSSVEDRLAIATHLRRKEPGD